MRKRRGRTGLETSCLPERETPERKDSDVGLEEQASPALAVEHTSAGGARESVFSWFDVLRSGAQLTLDVLRVIREATDLYRKLSGGRGPAGS